MISTLGSVEEQVLKKSMTGTTRRCDSSLLICWTFQMLAMDLGDSTNEAASCRMLVAKGADPSRSDDCWLTSRRKGTRACMSWAIQPLGGLDGTGSRVRKDEGRGSTRECASDWCTQRDSGKPNHTPKAYHHTQRRQRTARYMDDPWPHEQHRLRSLQMDITLRRLHDSRTQRCW